MTEAARPRLVALDVAAGPDAWRALGFAVDDGGRCRIGTTDVVLGGGGGGVTGWTLDGARVRDGTLDGMPTAIAPAADAAGPAHRNGVVAIDHVVVATPDLARTLDAFAGAGLEVRRTREAGTPDRPLRQAFLRLREALVEVVGPLEPDGDAPARLWGVTLVSGDLDATAAFLGDRLGAVRDAVQPGRRIAVVPREAGAGLPLALMTPRA